MGEFRLGWSFYWPNPAHRETLARSMHKMRDALIETPGCV